MSRSKYNRQHYSESLGTKFARYFSAFVLYVFILILSFSACMGLVFLNGDSISSVFTNNAYVTALRQDVVQYAEDLCNEAYIPHDSIEQELTYDVIYDIAISYADGNLCHGEIYTDTTYQSRIDDLQNSLASSTQEMLKNYKLNFDKADAEKFSSRVCAYIKEKTEFVYLDNIKQAVNIGRTTAIAAGAVSFLLIIITACVIIYIGRRRYRGLRVIAYSFTASSLFQLTAVIALEVFKKFKSLVVYPTYLCDSIISFIARCELTVLISASVSFVLALIVMAFVWRIKRNEK